MWRDRLFWFGYPLFQGHVGVVLFLVVSGFCIHGRAARSDPNQNPDFLPFWRRRLRRLYPPYLAAILLSVLSVIAVQACLQYETGQAFTAGAVWNRVAPGGLGEYLWAGLVNLFLITPFWPKALDLYGNYPFWSLALEEQLYLLYFLIPWLRRRIGMERVLLLTLAVSLAWRALAIFGPLGYGRPMMSHIPYDVVGALGPAPAMLPMNMGPSRWFEWVLGAAAVSSPWAD